MTHSGLQKQVLSLYRSLLRLAQQKQPQLMEHIRGNNTLSTAQTTAQHSTAAAARSLS